MTKKLAEFPSARAIRCSHNHSTQMHDEYEKHNSNMSQDICTFEYIQLITLQVRKSFKI